MADYDPIADATTVANHLTYDAFGNITSETNAAIDHIFAYTGRERDKESDLYYYRARYYDPRIGQFLSEDPIGFGAGDANLRRYVGNSSTFAVDPSGLDELMPSIGWDGMLIDGRFHGSPSSSGSSLEGPPEASLGGSSVSGRQLLDGRFPESPPSWNLLEFGDSFGNFNSQYENNPNYLKADGIWFSLSPPAAPPYQGPSMSAAPGGPHNEWLDPFMVDPRSEVSNRLMFGRTMNG